MLKIQFKNLTCGLALCLLPVASPADDYSRDQLPLNVFAESAPESWEIELHDGTYNNWSVGKLNLDVYDLEHPGQIHSLQSRLQELLDAHQATDGDFLSKDANRALELSIGILKLLNNTRTDAPLANSYFYNLREAIFAFNSNFKKPIEEDILLITIPFEVIKRFHNPTYLKRRTKDTQGIRHTSLNNSVVNSSKNQRSVDTYYGFGRSRIPKLENCKYIEPKTSYGVHGGFKIECGKHEKKIKFGNESKTEPFNSRFFWLLGYNVIPVDYVSEFKLPYNQKIMSEYNSRKHLYINIKSLAGFSYFKKSLQVSLNPFEEAIKGAKLIDGRTINSAQLQALILNHKPNQNIFELRPEDFNPIGEAQVAELIFHESSVEHDLENAKDIGRWSWSRFDHPDRQDLRAAGIYASFVNLFDTRTDNNKLYIVKEDNGYTLKHFISDLGSGLGNASNLLANKNGRPNEFPWSYLKEMPGRKHGPRKVKARSKHQVQYYIKEFNTTERNKTFENIGYWDAVWAARQLAKITEQQIMNALVASGWSAAEAKLYLEKLVHRRQDLIKKLSMADEFPELMSRPVDRDFHYQATRANSPYALVNGRKIYPPLKNQYIKKGTLKEM